MIMVDWLMENLIVERIYWYLAIPFTALLVLQLIATFLGIGGDDGDDFGDDGDSEPTFKVFTIKNFITFFAVFGWSGITFTQSGLGNLSVIIISTLLGIIVLLIVSGLFYFITKLTDNGTMNVKRAIGVTGEVYLPIPANRNGVGKINITFQGSFRELDAMTDSDKKLPRGTIVVVRDVVNGSILLVEKTKKGEM